MKKIIALLICMPVILSLCACGGKGEANPGTTGGMPDNTANQTAATEIYFLNFKPEIANVYNEIADEYKKETGVSLKVVTAASDTYEQTLMSEIAKKDAPTIFQVNGSVGYKSWKNYCMDLKDTKLYSLLSDKNLAIESDGGVYGIPYVVEAYGIIYNDDITDRYFDLKDRQKEVNSMDEVKSFKALKTVVEDMTKHKKELEIDGVFASTSFSSGNQWRWQSHLTNVPMYYEFIEKDKNANPVNVGLTADEITFKYAENYKNIFDLYINNSGTEKGLLGGKSVNDSMAEFALGKVAMVQNGTWSFAEMSKLSGNKVSEDDVKFLPIYTGIDGEEKQGLCVGTENYICINSKVSEEKQKASADFLAWLFSSEMGKKYVVEELKFIAPFTSFSGDEDIDDPLSKEAVRWMNRDGIFSVPWVFTSFPSDVFKEEFGSALLEYTQGSQSWEQVKNRMISSWKNEKK